MLILKKSSNVIFKNLQNITSSNFFRNIKMKVSNFENKLFHLYLQIGFILPSSLLLVASECVSWSACVSIPFLAGVLPAVSLVFILKKNKSKKYEVNIWIHDRWNDLYKIVLNIYVYVSDLDRYTFVVFRLTLVILAGNTF